MAWRDVLGILVIGMLGVGLIRDMPSDVKLRDRHGRWVWGFYVLTWFGLLYLLGRIVHGV